MGELMHMRNDHLPMIVKRLAQSGLEPNLPNPKTAVFHWPPKHMSVPEQKSGFLIRRTLGTGAAKETELPRNPREENKEGPR